jgi:hypothetical protein
MVDVGGRLHGHDWEQLCCGQWTARDLAGHVLAVAGWYHQWLDRALDGHAAAPFVSSELTARNAMALSELDESTGPVRLERFAASALDYADRVAEHWELPYGFPYGRVTAGVHFGAAASEWNVHAWDLSTVTPQRHMPSDPALLYELLGTALAAGRTSLLPSRLSVGLARRSARRVARGLADPWSALLERTGRQP